MNPKLAFKMLVIGVVTGAILIALAIVNGTITDRQRLRQTPRVLANNSVLIKKLLY
jgi:hypothetical protein